MKSDNAIEVKVFQQTKQGESVCGDSFFYIETKDEFICVLADGLGSGIYAKESSQAIVDVMKENYTLDEGELVNKFTKELHGKRGVVLGILRLNFKTKRFIYSSIGNIDFITKQINEKKKMYIPKRGILTNYKQTFKKIEEPLVPGMFFLMFTDGIVHEDLFKHVNPFSKKSEWILPFPDDYVINNNDDITVITMYYNG